MISDKLSLMTSKNAKKTFSIQYDPAGWKTYQIFAQNQRTLEKKEIVQEEHTVFENAQLGDIFDLTWAFYPNQFPDPIMGVFAIIDGTTGCILLEDTSGIIPPRNHLIQITGFPAVAVITLS